MSTTFDATVPEGLTELLEEFAITVLKERPSDLVQFAAHYFQNLHMSRRQTETVPGSVLGVEQPVGMDVENESDDEEFEPPRSYREAMNSRRKSVFGESYEPDDQESVEDKVVHPKSDAQRKRLIESVKNIFLFKSLDAEQANEVLDAMFERKVNKNDKVIVQGDDGDNFYVVDSGTFDVFVSRGSEDPKLVFNYNNEGSFGELALMYNTPRAATVVATSTGVLWALDRTTFRRIICGAASRKREMYQSFLESVPMLKTLEPYELLNLADALEKKQFSDGECIIKQGDQASTFYIVEVGAVKILKEDPNNPGSHAELGNCTAGQYFGELALITNKPRAASVYAVGPVTCAALDVGVFERLLGPCMDVMKRNFEHYEDQLMQLFGTTLDITDTR